jgi:hypothetical protein
MMAEPGGGSREAVPDLTLERYRLGELPSDEADRLARRIASDAELGRRLEALDREDREFAAAGASESLVTGVMNRLDHRGHAPGRRAFIRPLWAVPAVVAITLAAIVIWPARTDDSDCCADRPKGPAASLLVYRNTPSGGETLADNDVVRPGDVVRLGYRAAAAGFGAIVSVDGRGVLTRHLPADAEQAVSLEPGQLVLLDRAFELDDAPQVERFYLITAPAPFDLAVVLDAVRAASADIGRGVSHPLALPERFTHVVFSLRKDSRP